LNIFIAEDSETMTRALTELICEIPGTQIVGTAQTASEAIESITEKKPDVVILDVRLKEGNGIDVLKEIRGRANKAKVIVFTNYPFPQYQRAAYDAGADYFFRKATETDKLIEVLASMMQ
jgi:DNA-binding NarL/FixJ family response regulator